MKYIFSIIILLVVCSKTVAQNTNTVNIYNGRSWYGDSLSDYDSGWGTTNIIVPYYYTPFWAGPTTSYAMYRSWTRPQRTAQHNYIWTIKHIQKDNARFRNRMRIAALTGYVPVGPTMYDTIVENKEEE